MQKDINKMSMQELKAHKAEVEKAIATLHERRLREAAEAAEKTVRELGFSLSDIMNVQTKKSRKPVKAKYVHPENPEITWSGRGRKPLWVVEGIENGKTLEDFAVEK